MYRVKWNRSFERPTDTGQSLTVTEVHIVQEEPYQVEIMMELDGDFSNVAHSDVIQAVLDKFYKDTYIDRANQEKFSEVDKQIKKGIDELNKLKTKIITEMQAEQEKNRLAILEIGEYIAELMEKVEGSAEHDVHTEDASTIDKTMEGGE